MSDYGRIPLKKGDELYLKLKDARGENYTQKAVVEEFIGKGATCLTYTVDLYKDDTNASRMIMKEFYPQTGICEDGIQIKREGKELNITVEPHAQYDFVKESIRFRNAYVMQNRLSGSDAMEIMVKPYQIAEYGDSQYLLSDIHKGEVLNLSEIEDFSKKIWLIYRTAEAVSLLHEQGYLYMDLNPKNILWIESQQIVKLFDVDSIIPYRNLDNVHEIRVTKPYVAPEIENLESWFEINKKTFLKPSWDIYCLGLLLFEMVFGRFPTEKDLETACGKEGELEAICSQNEYDDEILSLLKKILKRSLSRKFRTRYKSAEEMCGAVNELKIRIDARAFISKKEFAKANATMKAYYMLDRWPLYQFTNKENELDIALVGNHPMREEFVKAVYSCTHMLEGVTRIRLHSQDAKAFWDGMEEKNPLLSKTVRLYWNGKCIRAEYDMEICSKPIAEIYLYENEEIRNIESNYILLLQERKECKDSIQQIKEQCENAGQKLVAYLDDGSNFIHQADYLEQVIVPISMRDKCSYYDERLLETELLQRALNVHALYYRNNHKRATWEEIREDFESNIYNIESSMRSALTVKYKLFCIGLDIEAKDISEQFYEKVLSDDAEAKELYRKLVALEHLSWSSFLIINGWDLPSREQIEEYAFVGKNDFKEKQRCLHPCLVECGAGRGLEDWTHEEWELPIETNEKVQQLDGLDIASIVLHQIAKKKSRKAAKKIDNLLETLGELVQGYRFVELQNAYQWLVQVKNRIFAGEVTAEALWRQAESNLLATAKRLGISNPQFRETIGGVSQELRVVNEYNSFHEYKKSDGAIISGMPYILAGEKIKRVIKPYTIRKKERWKNILAALYLEPEELIFVPDYAESHDDSRKEIELYKKLFKKRGIKTKKFVQVLDEVGKEAEDTVWDVTGLSETQIAHLRSRENMEAALFISLEDGEIVGLPNYVRGQFSRNTHLQVEEIFELFDEPLCLSGREETALLLGSLYQKIWSAYRKTGPAAWNQMAEKLAYAEKRNQYSLPGRKKGNSKIFQTEPVSGKALYLTEIYKILRKCKEEGLIEDYFYPGEEDELSVRVTTTSEELFLLLNKLIQMADEEPLKHRYRFVKEKSGTYSIYDNSLYARLRSLDKEVEATLQTVEEEGRDPVRQQILLQNCKTKNGAMKFKYATEAVKHCLQNPDLILDIVLYYACQTLGRFDDIDIGTGNKIWCSENTKMNCVSAKVVSIDGIYFLEVCCKKDCFGLLGETKTETYRYLIRGDVEELQKNICEFYNRQDDQEEV